MRQVVIVAGICGALVFGTTDGAQAGWGKSFLKNIKGNAKANAQKKVETTKSNVTNRVDSAKMEAVGEATGTNPTELSKQGLIDAAKQKATEKVGEVSPLAGEAVAGGDPKESLKASYQARVDAMKANLTPDALKDKALTDVTGQDVSGGVDGGSLSDGLKARLDALKADREARLLGNVTGSTGILDTVGATSGTIVLATCSAAELQAVDGIEAADAAAIISFRDQNGGMVENDLIKVVGFKKYLLIRTHLAPTE